jgi:signal transduction histidine kinase
VIQWWRRRSVLFRDGSIGVLVMLLGASGVLWDSPNTDTWPERIAGLALAGASGVAVALRRRNPSAALVIALVSATVAVPAGFDAGTDFLAAVICGYTAAAYPNWFSPRRVFAAMALVAVVASALSVPFAGYSVLEAAGGLLLLVMLVTLTVGLGTSVRSLRQTAMELAARNAELEALRRAEAERAVAEERTRIARELHDLVAHHVSAIVVTARAGIRAGEMTDPARTALQTVVDTGTEALTAMRRLVSVLRASDDEAELEPQPGLAELGGLVDSFRRIGLRVDFEQPPLAVPADVGLTAYRIVQEALTNVLRHAGTRRAWVKVTAEDGLIVTVEDDGRGPAPDHVHAGLLPPEGHGQRPPEGHGQRPPEGHGLLGMRERAALVDGVLELDRSPRGGWRVRAWLPLGRTAPRATDDRTVVPWRRVS